MKNFDETQWAKTRDLLREHLAAPAPEYPEMINSRVLEAIEREGRAVRRPAAVSLRWLAWSGVGLLATAALLSVVFLPGQMGPRSEQDFISQVIDARAETPPLSVTSFAAPDKRGVVLWVEGAAYIPPEKALQ